MMMVTIWFMMVNIQSGWWLTTTPLKNGVNWDDDIPFHSQQFPSVSGKSYNISVMATSHHQAVLFPLQRTFGRSSQSTPNRPCTESQDPWWMLVGMPTTVAPGLARRAKNICLKKEKEIRVL